jgi:hypothetical protein
VGGNEVPAHIRRDVRCREGFGPHGVADGQQEKYQPAGCPAVAHHRPSLLMDCCPTTGQRAPQATGSARREPRVKAWGTGTSIVWDFRQGCTGPGMRKGIKGLPTALDLRGVRSRVLIPGLFAQMFGLFR